MHRKRHRSLSVGRGFHLVDAVPHEYCARCLAQVYLVGRVGCLRRSGRVLFGGYVERNLFAVVVLVVGEERELLPLWELVLEIVVDEGVELDFRLALALT